MIVLMLGILGLCLGSFVNALVWRTYQRNRGKKSKDLSILTGRSICTHCSHNLKAIDLVPVLSWLWLRGKCRYCHKPIEDSPLSELITAGLFIASYLWWPNALHGSEVLFFGFWLVFLTGFMALIIYDKRWLVLPDRIIYPLLGLAAVQTIIKVALGPANLANFTAAVWGLAIGGGIFYLLFQISDGQWIGGGDVKLGAILGLILGGPVQSAIMLFLAAVLGSGFSLPLLVTKKLKANSQVPFGPFLIVSTILMQLFGLALIGWYKRLFLPLGS